MARDKHAYGYWIIGIILISVLVLSSLAAAAPPGCVPSPFGEQCNGVDDDCDADNDIDEGCDSDQDGYVDEGQACFDYTNWGYANTIPKPADYDGDGRADITVYDPTYTQPNSWYIIKSGGGTIMQNWGWAGVTPVPADYDYDGKDDIAVFCADCGVPKIDGNRQDWWVLKSRDGKTDNLEYGYAGTLPVPADYSGDGALDLAVWEPSRGFWFINGITPTDSPIPWGWNECTPWPGDYDGDGKADLAVYCPDKLEGQKDWAIRYSKPAPNPYDRGEFIEWGGTGLDPVPADYDGDGITDIAVVHRATSTWYFLRSTDGLYQRQNNPGHPYGWSATIPAPADYDGDGKADMTVYYPAGGGWYSLALNTTGIAACADNQGQISSAACHTCAPAYRDCSDGDQTIYPEAKEIPNDGIDQNCNGWEDEQVLNIFYSDSNTIVSQNPATLTWNKNGAWSSVKNQFNTIQSPAQWIWSSYKAVGTTSDVTKTFTRTINFDAEMMDKNWFIQMAADDSFTFSVNGKLIHTCATGCRQSIIRLDITPHLIQGDNLLEWRVTNKGTANSDWSTNPAGLIYQIGADEALCDSIDNNHDGIVDEYCDFDQDLFATALKECPDDKSFLSYQSNVAYQSREAGTKEFENGVEWTYYHSNLRSRVLSCDTNRDDCNDNNQRSYPNATANADICDGIDNDCNSAVQIGQAIVTFPSPIDEGFDLDNDTYSTCGNSTDPALDGYFSGIDCNDNNARINPGAKEGPINMTLPSSQDTCFDGIDNNCNNQTDCADNMCGGAPNINAITINDTTCGGDCPSLGTTRGCCAFQDSCALNGACTNATKTTGTIPNKLFCYGNQWFGGDGSSVGLTPPLSAACIAVVNSTAYIRSGESDQFGGYSSYNQQLCCGDDTGEFSLQDSSTVLLNPICCNSANDTAVGGTCVVDPSLKATWNGNMTGFCVQQSECLVNPLAESSAATSRNATDIKNPLNNPVRCIQSGQYIGDHLCVNGNWTTRTAALANQLITLAGNSDYTVYCTDFKNATNYLTYLPDQDSLYTAETYFGYLSAICQLGSGTHTTAVPCTNNVCVLSYAGTTVVATSLNQPINVQPYSFLQSLGIEATGCNNQLGSTSFAACDADGPWYNAQINSVMYTPSSIPSPAAIPSTNLIDHVKLLFRSLFSTLSEKSPPNAFLNTTQNFDHLYAQKKGDKQIRVFMEQKGPIKALSATYTNFGVTDICKAANISATSAGFTRFSCFPATANDHNQYIITKGIGTSANHYALFDDLGPKMRLP